MKKILGIIFLVIGYWLLVITPRAVALECGDTIPSDEGQLREYIDSCNTKLSDLSGQKATLAEAISYLNTQISLTTAKIASSVSELAKLEIEIQDLESRIDSLDYSLDDLTKLFVERVRATYMYRSDEPTSTIAQATGIPDLLRNLEYSKKVRDHDRLILIALEKSRLDYDEQKTQKEEKQKEIEALKRVLDSQKSSLNSQKAAKDSLLTETKNSEREYQRLLSTAQAELVAIQGIVAGLGKEVKIKPVSAGERVASIIQGASPCSTGTHLHFEAAQNGSRRNPFELLQNTSLEWDNADSPQNGSGSWSWPINSPIRITQGYGHTAYSSRYAGDIHTGVDMVGGDATVKAVQAGDLYQGSMKCGSGNLIYVRVEHQDGYDTYYLHVNY